MNQGMCYVCLDTMHLHRRCSQCAREFCVRCSKGSNFLSSYVCHCCSLKRLSKAEMRKKRPRRCCFVCGARSSVQSRQKGILFLLSGSRDCFICTTCFDAYCGNRQAFMTNYWNTALVPYFPRVLVDALTLEHESVRMIAYTFTDFISRRLADTKLLTKFYDYYAPLAATSGVLQLQNLPEELASKASGSANDIIPTTARSFYEHPGMYNYNVTRETLFRFIKSHEKHYFHDKARFIDPRVIQCLNIRDNFAFFKSTLFFPPFYLLLQDERLFSIDRYKFYLTKEVSADEFPYFATSAPRVSHINKTLYTINGCEGPTTLMPSSSPDAVSTLSNAPRKGRSQRSQKNGALSSGMSPADIARSPDVQYLGDSILNCIDASRPISYRPICTSPPRYRKSDLSASVVSNRYIRIAKLGVYPCDFFARYYPACSPDGDLSPFVMTSFPDSDQYETLIYSDVYNGSLSVIHD